jgi:glyoxylase-like metal-dependent hydrolase (beta-lactamase superfamily II)
MCLVSGEHEVAPGIRMLPVRGHNRDMTVLAAESGGRRFCFLSDLVPTAVHVTPTWVAAFDLFPMESIDNKYRWLGDAAREGWFCGFAHDPETAFARVVPYKERFETADEVR